MQRRYHLSFAELVDRLTIVQAKENFSETNKEAFAKEIEDIVHDIQLFIDEGVAVTGDMIRAIIVLTQANLSIWINEDNAREAKEGENNLVLTHRLNGTRSTAKTKIQQLIGGRIDPKLNCLAADKDPVWKISW